MAKYTCEMRFDFDSETENIGALEEMMHKHFLGELVRWNELNIIWVGTNFRDLHLSLLGETDD
jgi:hypothetical protein